MVNIYTGSKVRAVKFNNISFISSYSSVEQSSNFSTVDGINFYYCVFNAVYKSELNAGFLSEWVVDSG
jgi:hypothetical protein